MFGAMIGFIILAASLNHHPIKALPSVENASDTCLPATVWNCELDVPDGSLSTNYSESVAECQDLCHSANTILCQYFVYNCKTKSCNLHAEELMPAVNTCGQKGGGPDDPCRVYAKDACDGFYASNCTQGVNSIGMHHHGIDGFRKCGELCRQAPDCEYFIFDSNDRVCDFFEDWPEYCPVVVGPPSPNVKECFCTDPCHSFAVGLA